MLMLVVVVEARGYMLMLVLVVVAKGRGAEGIVVEARREDFKSKGKREMLVTILDTNGIAIIGVLWPMRDFVSNICS